MSPEESQKNGGSIRFVTQRPHWNNIFFSVVIFAIILLLSEIICGHINSRHVAHSDWSSITEPDPELGYRLKCNASCIDRRILDGNLVYQARYSTNSLGRRAAPILPPLERSRFAAFFGCSYTFGQGINDNETFAASFNRAAPEYMSYNFACPGYAPQHTLQIVQSPIEQEISQQVGVGIYTLLVCHVNRVIGGMSMVTTWGRHFANYELRNGTLSREGSFDSAHPWKNIVFDVLGKSQTLRAFNVGWPLWYSDEDYELTARILGEAARIFRKKWPGSEFYVLLYPEESMKAYVPIFKKHFERVGIPTLYFPDVLNSLPVTQRTVDGGHPTGAANQLLMNRLALELKRLNSGNPVKSASIAQ